MVTCCVVRPGLWTAGAGGGARWRVAEAVSGRGEIRCGRTVSMGPLGVFGETSVAYPPWSAVFNLFPRTRGRATKAVGGADPGRP
eukprot:6837110-Prymnesium_polylepis.2